MFFTIGTLLAPFVGSFSSLLIALPVLVLITRSLGETTKSLPVSNSKYVRRPTSVSITLLLIAVLAYGVSLLLSSLSLLLLSVTVTVYLGVLGVIVVRKLPLKPVEETQVHQRMVAGSADHLYIDLNTTTDIGGVLLVESPYEWLNANPRRLSLREDKPILEVSLSPPLSGPSVVRLNAYAVDRWGLIQTRFELSPIRLYVIPRARYAAWLARKYMAETRPGALPLISNIGTLRTTYGLRRGIEYYGSQLYQPGDSLKSIDWKHSLKYNELITKEFAEFHGQSAIVLINLVVNDAEEADKLAYKIIVTALSLAGENVPAALAAYDNEGVRTTTTTLRPRQLLLQSLEVAREIVTFINPVRYLNPPDLSRLRANMKRVQFVESESSTILAQLLQLEYSNLRDNARVNPVTKALSEVFSKVDKRSNIVTISHRNHDAEALAFNTFKFTEKGNAVITV